MIIPNYTYHFEQVLRDAVTPHGEAYDAKPARITGRKLTICTDVPLESAAFREASTILVARFEPVEGGPDEAYELHQRHTGKSGGFARSEITGFWDGSGPPPDFDAEFPPFTRNAETGAFLSATLGSALIRLCEISFGETGKKVSLVRHIASRVGEEGFANVSRPTEICYQLVHSTARRADA